MAAVGIGFVWHVVLEIGIRAKFFCIKAKIRDEIPGQARVFIENFLAHPIGEAFTFTLVGYEKAFLFSILQQGAIGMELVTAVPSEFIDVLQAIIVLVVVAGRVSLNMAFDWLATRRTLRETAQ